MTALLAGLPILLIAAVSVGVYAIHFNITLAMESYAQWGVARMIIEHIRENDGAWPRSWDDLAPYEQHTMGSIAFDQLPAVVGVDFEADSEMLARTPESTHGEPPFRVVWLRNGRRVHYRDQEPNKMIWEHLVRSVERSP